jgi:hypothetical protein
MVFTIFKKVKHIMEQRNEQLINEEQIDYKLIKLKNDCPKIVSNLLLYQRMQNRRQTNTITRLISNNDYFNAIDVTLNQLEHINYQHHIINEILTTDNACNNLTQFLYSVNKVIITK